MSLQLQCLASLQFILAALLGAIIGLDRERRHRPAGLRTHMLVSVGACIFTSIAIYAFTGNSQGQITSTIVVGVGFLGAGTIMRQQDTPHDLTTAATIWVTAAIGMAVGVGAWFLALCGTLLIWIILVVIWRLEGQRYIPPPAQPANPPK